MDQAEQEKHRQTLERKWIADYSAWLRNYAESPEEMKEMKRRALDLKYGLRPRKTPRPGEARKLG